jgi:hypothetical protein
MVWTSREALHVIALIIGAGKASGISFPNHVLFEMHLRCIPLVFALQEGSPKG